MSNPIRLIYFLSLIFCAVGLSNFPRWTVDDAFISFRYAENMVRHGELNWNPGADPVEGYTGIALPVIAAAWIKMGSEATSAGRVVGMAGFFLLIAGFGAWLRQLKIEEPVRAVAFAGLATNPILFTHATSGLETMLFIATVVGCLVWIQKLATAEVVTPRDEATLWLMLLGTSLVRPEGVALAVVAGVVLLARARGESLRRRAIFMTACYLIPGAIYFIWRWNYYERLLPNTFYAKNFEGVINAASAMRMGEFAHTFLSIPMAMVAVAWAIARVKGTSESHAESEASAKSWTSLLVAGIFSAVLALEYLRSELVMNYSCRFFVPFLPVIWALAAYWVHETTRRAGWIGERRFEFSATGVAIVVIAFNAIFLPGEVARARGYALTMEYEHAAIGKRLAEIMPPDESVACVIDAGAIPFYSRLKAYDFGKLNDEFLADGVKSPGEVADYFFLMRPGAAVFTTRNWRRVEYLPESEAITMDARFEEYEPVERFRVPREKLDSSYYQILFLRRELREKLGMEKIDLNAGE